MPASRIHLPTVMLIVLLGAIYRAGIAAPEACISRDGVWFVEMARKLADEPVRHMRIETKQPGFSFMLLAAHRLAGDAPGRDAPEYWQLVGTTLAGIAGVAVCVLIYVITLRLFAPTVATVAGIFAVFWPQGARLSADVLSDMPHLAMYLGAVAFMLAGSSRTLLIRSAAAGLLGGAAYWFRLEALGLAPAILVWLIWTAPAAARRRSLLAAALFAAMFAACAAPYVVLARTNLDVAPVRAALEGAGAQWANAVAPLELPGRLAEEWAKSGRYVFAALFLACLFIRFMPRAARPAAWLIGLIGVVHLALVAARVLKYGELSGRYMVILAAVTIPWSAAALVYLVQLAILKAREPSPYRYIPIWATALMLTVFPLVFYGIQPVNAERMSLRQAGVWLRERAAAQDVILAADDNLTQVQYYANHIYPRRSGWEQFTGPETAADRAAAIERIGPRWIVAMDADSTSAPESAYQVAMTFGGDDQHRITIWKRAEPR